MLTFVPINAIDGMLDTINFFLLLTALMASIRDWDIPVGIHHLLKCQWAGPVVTGTGLSGKNYRSRLEQNRCELIVADTQALIIFG